MLCCVPYFPQVVFIWYVEGGQLHSYVLLKIVFSSITCQQIQFSLCPTCLQCSSSSVKEQRCDWVNLSQFKCPLQFQSSAINISTFIFSSIIAFCYNICFYFHTVTMISLITRAILGIGNNLNKLM